jgi:hypothetical protein
MVRTMSDSMAKARVTEEIEPEEDMVMSRGEGGGSSGECGVVGLFDAQQCLSGVLL